MGLSWPLLIGVISAVLVSTVDTYFVSFLGSEPLTAIGYTFPVAMAGVSVAFGLGTGAAAIIARSIGAGRAELGRRQTFQILTVSLFLVVGLSFVGLMLIEPIFGLLGADEMLMPLIAAYMTPWFLGLVFLVIPMVGTAVIRGYGSTSVQTYVMITASVLNAVLDPILIFGIGGWDGWGIEGAAWASVISRAVTMLVMLWFLFRPEQLVSFSKADIVEWLQTASELLRLGIPAALVGAVAPLATMLVIRVLSSIGPDAVAAFTIGARIEALALIPAMALSMGIGPFVSQNFGAGRTDRIDAAWRFVGKYAVVVGVAGAVIFLTLGPHLVAPFNTSEVIAVKATEYLHVLAFALVGSALIPIFSSMQSAHGNASPGLIISVIRFGGLYAPGAFIGRELYGFEGVLLGIAFAHLASAVIALFWGAQTFGHLHKEADDQFIDSKTGEVSL